MPRLWNNPYDSKDFLLSMEMCNERKLFSVFYDSSSGSISGVWNVLETERQTVSEMGSDFGSALFDRTSDMGSNSQLSSYLK